jgi:hypothetical protein
MTSRRTTIVSKAKKEGKRLYNKLKKVAWLHDLELNLAEKRVQGQICIFPERKPNNLWCRPRGFSVQPEFMHMTPGPDYFSAWDKVCRGERSRLCDGYSNNGSYYLLEHSLRAVRCDCGFIEPMEISG